MLGAEAVGEVTGNNTANSSMPGPRPPITLNDGGAAWPLPDGGWAFQYPKVAIHVGKDGTTRMAWQGTEKTIGLPYSMEIGEGQTSYHVGDAVIHQEANGDM
eukprot:5249421-Amphidinium_carterae.1